MALLIGGFTISANAQNDAYIQMYWPKMKEFKECVEYCRVVAWCSTKENKPYSFEYAKSTIDNAEKAKEEARKEIEQQEEKGCKFAPREDFNRHSELLDKYEQQIRALYKEFSQFQIDPNTKIGQQAAQNKANSKKTTTKTQKKTTKKKK